MKNRFSFWCAAVAVLSVAGVARADLSWEHTITVRLGKVKQPLARVKMYNNWSGERHRLLLKYALSDLGRIPRPNTSIFESSAFTPTPLVAGSTHYGSLGFVHRFDDDRFVAYTSEARMFISEPLRPLLKRLRFDPWKKRAFQLSKEAIPAFSLEQRRRLGREVRAVSAPYVRKVWRTYFRPLNRTRTFQHATGSTPGHGYRMTWLINGGGMNASDAQWVKVSFEWWLASELAGDELVRHFQQTVRENLQSIGWPSASLWINETLPILWQTLPEELHQAAKTLMPQSPSPRAGFGGTPLLMSLTVEPPAMQRVAFGGDLRIDIALNRRDAKVLGPKVFDAPDGYERMPLDPQLKRFENMIESTTARLEKENEALGLSWQAWHQSSAALAPLLPLGLLY